MTQKEKQVLLKDLCARLPYGVICVTTSVYYDGDDNEIGKAQGRLVSINRHRASFVDDRDDTTFGADFEENGQIGFQPCLRPMSSMTEEERIEFSKLLVKRYCEEDWEGHISTSYCIEIDNVYTDDENGIQYPSTFSMDAIDWLNARHFDYRGLIGKGLALPAPEGMY